MNGFETTPLTGATLLDALFLAALFVIIGVRINAVEKRARHAERAAEKLQLTVGEMQRRIDGMNAERLRAKVRDDSMVATLLRERADSMAAGRAGQDVWPLVLCAQCRLPISRDDASDASGLQHARCAVG